MRRISLFIAILFVGTTIGVGSSQAAADPGVTVLSSSSDRTVLQFDVTSFDLRDVLVEGETYSAVVWDDGTARQVRGEPAVPSFHTSIVIPDDAQMGVRVVESEYEEYTGVRIAPSKGPITRDILPQTVPYVFSDVYQTDAFYPAEVAALAEPYIMRDVRGIVVDVNPFQWNPVTETLRVYQKVVVEVTPIGPGRVNVLTSRPDKQVLEFQRIYRDHFANFDESTHRYSPVSETGRMLVVAHDDFVEAVQPLVDWRNQMGIETELVPLSMIGSTGNQLRSYCQSRFDDDDVCFFLLVGDAAQIPYVTNDGGAADPVLTLCAGGDSYPDAFVGRISAQNVAQVETQVERIIEYERDPHLSGRWYSRGVSIASNEGDGYGDDGEADWEHARNYRRDLLGFTYSRVDELYDGTHPAPPAGETQGADESGDPSAYDLAQLVNDGRSLVHYTGHGSHTSWASTGFDNGDINDLVNQNQLPMVVSVGCVNGAFETTTCFAETWMRATHEGEPTGGVACYMSTVNQQWATPMRAQDEMIDLLTTGTMRTWGGICFNGSCDMIDHYGSAGITEFKNWTVFGDPYIHIRTASPKALTVSHGGFVNPSQNQFEVQTAPEALVALSLDGAFLGSTYADESGLALVPYNGEDLGSVETVKLTVTGFNAVPNISDVPVQSAASVPDLAGVLAGGVRTAPNPFTSATQISFALAEAGRATLEIFDASGRSIRTMESGALPSGVHALVWNGTDDRDRPVGPGTYFYRLEAGGKVMTESVVLLK